jgi:hypothetical protein
MEIAEELPADILNSISADFGQSGEFDYARLTISCVKLLILVKNIRSVGGILGLADILVVRNMVSEAASAGKKIKAFLLSVK